MLDLTDLKKVTDKIVPSPHLTAFAKFKADKVAGPLNNDRTRQGLGFDNRTDPAAKAQKAIFARTKSSLVGRIQIARVNSIAERIMRITFESTIPHPRCTRNEAGKLNHHWVIWCALKLVISISGILSKNR